MSILLDLSDAPSVALSDHVVNIAEKSDKPAQDKEVDPPESKWPSASQPERIQFRESERNLQISNFGLQMKGHELKIYLTAVVHLGSLEIALNGLTLSLNFSKLSSRISAPLTRHSLSKD